MAAASTDDHFRDDKKGGLFSRKGPYLPGKIGLMGAPLYREDGAGGPFYWEDRARGPNEGGPQNFMTPVFCHRLSVGWMGVTWA